MPLSSLIPDLDRIFKLQNRAGVFWRPSLVMTLTKCIRILTIAETIGRIAFEQGSEQGLSHGTQVLWHAQSGLENLIHRLLSVLSMKGQLTCQHFILK